MGTVDVGIMLPKRSRRPTHIHARVPDYGAARRQATGAPSLQHLVCNFISTVKAHSSLKIFLLPFPPLGRLVLTPSTTTNLRFADRRGRRRLVVIDVISSSALNHSSSHDWGASCNAVDPDSDPDSDPRADAGGNDACVESRDGVDS